MSRRRAYTLFLCAALAFGLVCALLMYAESPDAGKQPGSSKGDAGQTQEVRLSCSYRAQGCTTVVLDGNVRGAGLAEAEAGTDGLPPFAVSSAVEVTGLGSGSAAVLHFLFDDRVVLQAAPAMSLLLMRAQEDILSAQEIPAARERGWGLPAVAAEITENGIYLLVQHDGWAQSAPGEQPVHEETYRQLRVAFSLPRELPYVCNPISGDYIDNNIVNYDNLYDENERCYIDNWGCMHAQLISFDLSAAPAGIRSARVEWIEGAASEEMAIIDQEKLTLLYPDSEILIERERSRDGTKIATLRCEYGDGVLIASYTPIQRPESAHQCLRMIYETDAASGELYESLRSSLLSTRTLPEN